VKEHWSTGVLEKDMKSEGFSAFGFSITPSLQCSRKRLKDRQALEVPLTIKSEKIAD
jgi:hypothetical protein